MRLSHCLESPSPGVHVAVFIVPLNNLIGDDDLF